MYLFNFRLYNLDISFKFLIFLFVIILLLKYVMVCYHKHISLKNYRFFENVLDWLHNNGWFLWKSNNCSFKIVTLCVVPVSNFIDILKSSLIIDI